MNTYIIYIQNPSECNMITSIHGNIIVMGHVTIPRAYAPVASDRAFWNGLDWSRFSGTLGAPTFLSDWPSTRYMWHVPWLGIRHSFYILVLVITSLFPSDPYVLFLEPHFCFISYVQPLCFPAVHLLCTIFIFCFLFQAMHSNHSSISMHVIFLLVLQYGNQLRLLQLLILAPTLYLAPTFTLLWPSEIEESYWCRGAAHKLKPILFPTPTSPTLDVASLLITTSPTFLSYSRAYVILVLDLGLNRAWLNIRDV